MKFFITATGTGVGKTFLTCGLVRALRLAGEPVRALKPVISGYDPEDFANSDTAHLLGAMGEPATAQSIAGLSPFRFAAPLSPDIAAAREGRAIDFDALLDTCRQPGPLLVEGVGGVMVPLTDRHTVLDWIAALDWPVLLVAGSYLGTISHTLTALTALRTRQASIAALIVNETPGGPALPETIATLRRFAPGITILTLPYEASQKVFQGLAEAVLF